MRWVKIEVVGYFCDLKVFEVILFLILIGSYKKFRKYNSIVKIFKIIYNNFG